MFNVVFFVEMMGEKHENKIKKQVFDFFAVNN